MNSFQLSSLAIILVLLFLTTVALYTWGPEMNALARSPKTRAAFRPAMLRWYSTALVFLATAAAAVVLTSS